MSDLNLRCRFGHHLCRKPLKTRYESCASSTILARRNHRTQQYSITALTDSLGTIQERYAYDAYGNLSIFDASGTARTTTAEGNRYTYTGREWDEELKLYHYRARPYDGVAGRFLSRDPIRYKGSKWLLYEFMETTPISLLDPLGTYTLGYPTGPVVPGTPTPHVRRFGCRSMKREIAFACSCVCTAYLIDLWWWVADHANSEGMRVANEHYPGNDERHRVLRHCVASGVMASNVGCKCARCVGTQRENWQDDCLGQNPRVGQQGIFNNEIGLTSAGCLGPGWSMTGTAGENATIQNCIDAVAAGHGDIMEDNPTMPRVVD